MCQCGYLGIQTDQVTRVLDRPDAYLADIAVYVGLDPDVYRRRISRVSVIDKP